MVKPAKPTLARRRANSGNNPDKGSPAHRNGVREVGTLLPDVAGNALRRFGFSQATLVSRWAEIVGPAYATRSTPESLRFPRGQTSGGTLTIRVEGPFALQLQHVAPQLVERVNRILGHKAVERLKLLQGEVPQNRQPPPRVPAPPTTIAGQSNLALPDAEAIARIRDEGLRAALLDLAAQLQARDGPAEIH